LRIAMEILGFESPISICESELRNCFYVDGNVSQRSRNLLHVSGNP
jgi:hypothetical protein